MSTLLAQLSSQIRQTKSICPSEEWLVSFIATQKSTTPIQVLLQTAVFRLLASDLTTTLIVSHTTCFPNDIVNVNCQECRLDGPIAVQMLSVEDLSKSRWERIETIEAVERGEQKKGREIIRVANVPDGEDVPNPGNDTQRSKSSGPHKLLLQDAAGLKVWGIELKPVKGVDLSMPIGCKFVLRNVLVARGLLLLNGSSTLSLGGKIEESHRIWRDGRKDELRAQIEAARSSA